ncbi:hypothetical protein KSP39_PZI018497 [Platanthera zijinensis]|uniref:HAT C-terminal dimerisation domain-containing protein n=1 Tax=Platanthera zijinensis TaxID=2320716 RepID=A0AAP0FYK4_9ASPA
MIELTESTLYRLYSHYDKSINITSTQSNLSQASSSGTATNQVDVEFSFVAYQKKIFMDDSDEDEATICASEIALYMKEDTLKLQTNFDILNWWRLNSYRFPILSQVARDVLAIPVSTVASESGFSTGGRILDPFRSSLAPKTAEALICARDWLRCKSNLNEIEEMLIDVDKYEELDKGSVFALNL